MKDPLIPPVAALAAGILAASLAPFTAPELLFRIAACLALGALAYWRNARALAAACALAGLVFAGALSAVAHQPGPPPAIDATARDTVILSGCVVEPPAVSEARERFLLELEPHARAQVTLFTRPEESLPALRYGESVELDAHVRAPRNYGNPGAFDFTRFLAREDIYWTASGPASSLRRLSGSCGHPIEGFAMNLRVAIIGRLERLYPAGSYQSGMMQALLVGQKYQMQRIWTEDYRNTGTFHTIVISGTHVAILAAFFLFLLRLCFVPPGPALALTPAWRGSTRWFRDGARPVCARPPALRWWPLPVTSTANAGRSICSPQSPWRFSSATPANSSMPAFS